MHDPFPIHPPAALAKFIEPIANKLGLQTLPLHIHEIAFAFTLYHVTYKYLAPLLSRALFPRIYPTFNARTKLNWDVHIVSFVQSTLINVLALYVMFGDQALRDMNWQGRVWGYTGASGLVQAFATGYFAWDLWVTATNVGIFGYGMLAHAVSALFVFSLGFRPFVNFYGPTFILYELSSPFLNIHWFCDKLNLTGTKIQLYNGILLLFTFFSCRLVWGSYQSVRVVSDVYRALKDGHVIFPDDREIKSYNGTAWPHHPAPELDIFHFATGERGIPMWLAICYLASNLTLNSLNWFWFSKMIATIRKRFDPPMGTRKPEQKTNEKVEVAEDDKVLVEGSHVETPGVMTPADMDEKDYITSVVSVEKDTGHSLSVKQTEVRSRSSRRVG